MKLYSLLAQTKFRHSKQQIKTIHRLLVQFYNIDVSVKKMSKKRFKAFVQRLRNR